MKREEFYILEKIYKAGDLGFNPANFSLLLKEKFPGKTINHSKILKSLKDRNLIRRGTVVTGNYIITTTGLIRLNMSKIALGSIVAIMALTIYSQTLHIPLLNFFALSIFWIDIFTIIYENLKI